MRRGSVSEQLVLWDIDGTLLNADGVGRDLYDVVFVQLFGRSIDAFAPMAGRTDRAIILETLTMAGVDEPRRYVDPFIAGLTAQAPSVREMVAVRGRALPGASDVLRGLQGRAHQSVLTGNIRPVAEVKLAAVGLRDGLDLCIGAYGDDHEIRAELVPVAQDNGVRLGIEALHPVFAADRCVISRLGEAIDLAGQFPADAVGVVVDTYHLWWDASLLPDIARAGDRIVSYQVCDWILPLPADTLLGRGHVGDGHIDFPPITAAVESAGYTGHIEVEIFNQQIWDAPPDQTAATVRQRFAAALGSG